MNWRGKNGLKGVFNSPEYGVHELSISISSARKCRVQLPEHLTLAYLMHKMLEIYEYTTIKIRDMAYSI